jgi:hypothetical protein
MGIYDCYGNAQLKLGDVEMRDFQVGDEVPIPDGVYVDYGAVVVIKDGKFLAEFENLTTKWGDTVDSSVVLEPHSAVVQAMKDVKARLDDG